MKTFEVVGNKVSTGIPVEKENRDFYVSVGPNIKVYLGRRDTRKMIIEGCLYGASLEFLRREGDGELTGRFLLVSPRNDEDKQVLILWEMDSGPDGIRITGGRVIASHIFCRLGDSGKSVTLAVLRPGKELTARSNDRSVKHPIARLTWDGEKVQVMRGWW